MYCSQIRDTETFRLIIGLKRAGQISTFYAILSTSLWASLRHHLPCSAWAAPTPSGPPSWHATPWHLLPSSSLLSSWSPPQSQNWSSTFLSSAQIQAVCKFINQSGITWEARFTQQKLGALENVLILGQPDYGIKYLVSEYIAVAD